MNEENFNRPILKINDPSTNNNAADINIEEYEDPYFKAGIYITIWKRLFCWHKYKKMAVYTFEQNTKHVVIQDICTKCSKVKLNPWRFR